MSRHRLVLAAALCALSLVPAAATAAPGTQTVTLDGVPQVAAIAGDHLWVLVFEGDSPSLVKIDPTTARPTGRSVALPTDVQGQGGQHPSGIRASLVVAGGDLFVPAAEGLLQVDPEGAEIVRRLPFPSRYVAVGAAGLWAVGAIPEPMPDGRPGLLWPLGRIDPASGAIETLKVGPGLTTLGPVELAVGDADLWLSIPSSRRNLARVNPETGAWTGVPAGAAFRLSGHEGALYAVPRYGHLVEIRRGDQSRQVQLPAVTGTPYWRDLSVGPDGSAWGVLFRGPGRPGVLVRQPLDGLGYRIPAAADPVDVVVGSSAAWVVSAADRTLSRVPVGAVTPARDPVRLTAAQLRINQRIAQAALSRVDALTARVDGVPAPEPPAAGKPRHVRVSAAQLLINQRISQAALRRSNALAGRLEGVLPGDASSPSGDTVELSARQLLIGQRIAQAALRRVDELETRIPAVVNVPPPAPRDRFLDHVVGVLETAGQAAMTITQVTRRGLLSEGAPLAAGDRIPIVLPASSHPSSSFAAGSTVSADGVLHGGVFFGADVSIEPPHRDR